VERSACDVRPARLPGAKNILYHNRGDGTFEDVTTKATSTEPTAITPSAFPLWTSTTTAGSTSMSPATALPAFSTAITTNGTFTDVGVTAGAAFNEDGREQAGMGSTSETKRRWPPRHFKTNFSDDTSTLYRNNGDGTFDDVTTAAGLGLYTKYLGGERYFSMFDNDGWPESSTRECHVYPEVDKNNLGATTKKPRILYHNLGQGDFRRHLIQRRARHHDDGLVARSRGGDLWNDGRISAVITNLNAVPSLVVNQVRNSNHWIAIRTVGTKSNRDGIGARISVKVGARTLVDEVRSGSSYNSSSDMRVHFGSVLQPRSTPYRFAGPMGSPNVLTT